MVEKTKGFFMSNPSPAAGWASVITLLCSLIIVIIGHALTVRSAEKETREVVSKEIRGVVRAIEAVDRKLERHLGEHKSLFNDDWKKRIREVEKGIIQIKSALIRNDASGLELKNDFGSHPYDQQNYIVP